MIIIRVRHTHTHARKPRTTATPKKPPCGWMRDRDAQAMGRLRQRIPAARARRRLRTKETKRTRGAGFIFIETHKCRKQRTHRAEARRSCWICWRVARPSSSRAGWRRPRGPWPAPASNHSIDLEFYVWCLRVVETGVWASDDRECSGEPRTCASRWNCPKSESDLKRPSYEMQIDTVCRGQACAEKTPSARRSATMDAIDSVTSNFESGRETSLGRGRTI